MGGCCKMDLIPGEFIVWLVILAIGIFYGRKKEQKKQGRKLK